MDLINYATDPTKEVEGARVQVDKDTTLIIARFNNPPFVKMQARLTEPYVKAQGRKGVSTEQAATILTKCMAKFILLGWEGLKLDGRVVDFSPDMALELLEDERLSTFKEVVLMESQNMENFRIEKFEDDLGNSKRLSTTTRGGKKKSKRSSRG